MKKILTTLLTILISIGLFSQEKIRKGAYFVQNNDTVKVLYNDGKWVMESDTTFVVTVDTLRFADGTTLSTSGGGSGNPILADVTVDDTTRWGESGIPTYGTAGQLPVTNATADGFVYGSIDSDADSVTINKGLRVEGLFTSTETNGSNVGYIKSIIESSEGQVTPIIGASSTTGNSYIRFNPFTSTLIAGTTSANTEFSMNQNTFYFRDEVNDFMTLNSSGLNIDVINPLDNTSIDLGDSITLGGTPLGLSDVTGGGGGIPYSQTRDSIMVDDFDSLTASYGVFDSIGTSQADNAILQTKAQLADSLYNQYDSIALGAWVFKFDADSIWIDNGGTTTKIAP